MQSRSKGILAQELGDVGSAFVARRLNPADEQSYSYAVPDQETEPSYAQHFKNQRILSASDINGFEGENWHADIILLAHPCICYLYHQWDDNGHERWTCQLNGQLSVAITADPDTWTPEQFYACMNSFRDQCEKYRVLYTGLTGNMVASDMYNAGAVTAAQYAWEPAQLSTQYVPTQNDLAPVSSEYFFTYPTMFFPDMLKSYTQLCQMPLAYTSDAKYGFYMPLKIYDTKYRKTNDLVQYVVAENRKPAWQPDIKLEKWLTRLNYYPPETQPTSSFFFPIGGVNGNSLAGQMNLQYSSYYMGQISLRNISSQAQFYLTFRSGYQMVCTPGSMFTQYINPVTPYSPAEIASYATLAAVLKDCYPDSYNDWGKLKRVIGQVWNTVKPFIALALKLF